MPKNNIEVIFRQIGGVWQSINTKEPIIFCEWLRQNQIQFDDNCTFARYEMYEGKKLDHLTMIEIRHYGGQIRTNTQYIDIPL